MTRGFRPGAREFNDDAKVMKGIKAREAETERRKKLNEEKGFAIGVEVKTLDGIICRIVGFNERHSPILHHRSFVGRGDSRNTRPYDPSVLELYVPES